MRSPTEVLVSEHRIIEKVLDGLVAFATRVAGGQAAGQAAAGPAASVPATAEPAAADATPGADAPAAADAPPAARAIVARYAEFFATFADRCHHGKEEDLLFRALEERGLPVSCSPTAMMRHEHEEGRLHVRALARLGAGEGPLSPGERARLRETAEEYAALLRAHILKEDEILFPLAERMLDPEASRRLGAAFDHFECAHVGHGVHERMHDLAHSLMEGAAR